MTEHTVAVSVKGKWSQTAAMVINGTSVIVRGKWVRLAVIHNEQWMDFQIDDPELWIKSLKGQTSTGLKADIFTFSQRPPATAPMFQYHTEWESLAAISLTSYKEWWENLPQEGRKNVRRAEKRGVVIKVKPLDDDLVEAIVGVNNDSPIRQNRTFDHYGKTFEEVKRDQSTYLDRSDFICAYFEEELIGFLKLVYVGKVASILQILPKSSHSDKRPTNAMLAKAVELCEANGIAYLIYGMLNYGNKRDSSLRDFKVRNGFREILVPRYYIPLTGWGRICICLNLHRGLLGIVPPYVISAGLWFRAKWHILKSLPSRRSSMTEQPNRIRQMGCSNPPAGSNSNSGNATRHGSLSASDATALGVMPEKPHTRPH